MRGFGLHPLCFQVSLHFNHAQPRETVHPGGETKLMDAHGTGHRLQSCSLHTYTRVWGACVHVLVLGALSWLLQHRFFQLRDSAWCQFAEPAGRRLKRWEQKQVLSRLPKSERDFLQQGLPTLSYPLIAIPRNILANAVTVPVAASKHPRDFSVRFLKLLVSCL